MGWTLNCPQHRRKKEKAVHTPAYESEDAFEDVDDAERLEEEDEKLEVGPHKHWMDWHPWMFPWMRFCHPDSRHLHW